MLRQVLTSGLIAAGAILAPAVIQAAVVTSPYQFDFNDGTAGSLTLAAPASWSVGDGVLTSTCPGGWQVNSAIVQMIGSDTADFATSVQVAPIAFAYSGGFVALLARSTDSDNGSENSEGYSARLSIGFNDTATLSIFRGSTNLFDSTTFTQGNSSKLYTLALTGTKQVGGSLNLAASFSDSSAKSIATASFSDAVGNVVSVGDHYGLKARIYGGNPMTLQFDNYSVSVPEPASIGLLMISGAILARRRQR